jgi:hypothetical protein
MAPDNFEVIAMKYLCLAYGDENDWKQLSKDEQDALLKQDEVLRQRGDLVAAVDRAATTVKAWDGVPQTTDGGFAESRVPLAGFAIIDAPDLERAIELVADTPCARAKGAVELRPIDQINDHGAHHAEVLGRDRRLEPEPAPVVGDAHRRLGSFIGKWTVTGENKSATPDAPDTPVTGEEDYVWLPGGFFLLGHWDRRFGNDRHLGVSIIRHDPGADEYSAYNVDNLGFARTYRVTSRDGVWSFTGERERATMAFSDDGSSMTIDWERTEDGSTWIPLCHLEGKREEGGGRRE